MGKSRERRRRAAADGFSRASGEGAVRGAAPAFVAIAIGLAAVVVLNLTTGLPTTLALAHAAFFGLFLLVAGSRFALPTVRAETPFIPAPPAELPSYTVIVPLRDEACMARQIVGQVGRLRYPAACLQVLFVVEADDHATRDALLATGLPEHMHILVAPSGGPATKPRACNLALAQAEGDLVVIYDAEDQPDPAQLMEAAARFARAPPRLGCLQAPLRIVERQGFVQRQFALEYAALFEVVLPALAALRLPFPLGGTSNHFRRAALQAIGGWDAFNVTEDADVGLRLSLAGWRLGMLRSPTWEEAPETLDAWLPQRCRWLKGYAQTWSVMMRRPFSGGPAHVASVQATLGLSILTSLTHGPLALLTVASLLVATLELRAGPLLIMDAILLLYAWASAVVIMGIGARRAGFGVTWRDAAGAAAYWPAQSLAAVYALVQLVVAPYRWDKTPHRPLARPGEPPAARSLVALDGPRVEWLTKAA